MTANSGSRDGYPRSVRERIGGDGRGWLTRAVRRLTADEEDLDAEELQSDVTQAGATKVTACCRGDRVSVTGRLTSVVLRPRGSVPTLEAELFDGSGSVTLVWLGRRQITGIEPGRVIVARGRVAEREGTRVMFNPWYELKSAA